MRVLIDGKPHPVLAASPAGPAAVVREIDEVLEHRGRGIVQLYVNGRPWTIEQVQENLPFLSTAEVDTLEVHSEAMGVLVERLLLEVAGVIDELPSACHSLAAVLTGPERDAGLEEFDRLLEIWDALAAQHQDAIDLLKIKGSTVQVDGVRLAVWRERLWDQLEKGSALAASGDAAALADLVTYELVPFAESEKDLLEQLLERARSGGSG